MNIFSLTGEVLLNDAGVNKKLDDIDEKGKSTSKSMGSSFGSMASAAVKLGTVLGLGIGIKDMISNATTAQKTLALMGNALKVTHDASGMTQTGLVNLAGALSKTTEFSKGTTEQAENLLLTFTGIGKQVFPSVIKTAGDMSTALGTSLTGSVNILGKALSNPTKGVTALAKAHVVLTVAQTASIKKMQESGNMLGAQKALLADVEARYKGAAEAAGKTFGGQVTILKNGLVGMGTSLAMTVMPKLTEFATYINSKMPEIQKVVAGMIAYIVPKFQTWILLIGQIVQQLFPKFSTVTTGLKGSMGILGIAMVAITGTLTFMAKNIGVVKAALVLLTAAFIIHDGVMLINNTRMAISNTLDTISAVKKGIVAVATKGAAVAQWALNAAMDANPIAIVIAILIALGVIIYDVVTHFKVIKATVIDVWNGIKSVSLSVWNSIKSFLSSTWNGIKNIAVSVFDGVKTVVTNAWNTIASATSNIWGSIKNAVSSYINLIKQVIGVAMDVVTGNWSGAWSGIVTICKNLFGSVPAVIKTIIDGIAKKFTDFVKTAISFGSGIINGIVKGLKDTAGDLLNGVGEIITDVKNAFTKGFIVHSPSKWFEWLGGHLTGGLIKGMKGNNLKDFAESMVASIKDKFSSIGSMGSSLKGILTTAMSMEGIPLDQLPMLETIVQHESGGNASITNTTDSNAMAGHASVGLMQMIPSTFSKWMMPGFSGITNPLSNVLSGLRYITGRYGGLANTPGIKSLAKGGPYIGYSVGSRYIPHDMVAQIHEGEMITPKSENPYANSGGRITPNGNGMQVIINSPTPLNPVQTALELKHTLQELAYSL